ncbi:histidine phosphatase family protein [Thermosulfurimonas dismutans]|uniref:Phosphoglycerate mutase family n=1 Tax=Thermosulfurimonas dismutans TaxID=999894 RepID=A0A179D286_9BACT|nr:histidine phosphatase family protein [Thermosulfurimonas dismutans]OAQ19921.1 Phosphoglycerate mutase family [Thermosulfurimonas dismutans]
METKVYILRHGQTFANVEGRFAGRTPEPLTEEGERQARRAGEYLKGEDLSRIYISPLHRTRRTAELMAEVLDSPEIVEEPGFFEISIPPWEGRFKYELRKDPDMQYEVWSKAPHRFYIPGCETLPEVYGRAVRAMEDLFHRESGRVVAVVTHMVVVRVLLVHYLELPLSAYREVPVPNALPILLRRQGLTVTIEVPFGDGNEAEKMREFLGRLK